MENILLEPLSTIVQSTNNKDQVYHSIENLFYYSIQVFKHRSQLLLFIHDFFFLCSLNTWSSMRLINDINTSLLNTRGWRYSPFKNISPLESWTHFYNVKTSSKNQYQLKRAVHWDYVAIKPHYSIKNLEALKWWNCISIEIDLSIQREHLDRMMK